MPGQLVHTNEILVLLGDNWFAERSAKQASNIVKRRIKCKLKKYIFTSGSSASEPVMIQCYFNTSIYT